MKKETKKSLTSAPMKKIKLDLEDKISKIPPKHIMQEGKYNFCTQKCNTFGAETTRKVLKNDDYHRRAAVKKSSIREKKLSFVKNIEKLLGFWKTYFFFFF